MVVLRALHAICQKTLGVWVPTSDFAPALRQSGSNSVNALAKDIFKLRKLLQDYQYFDTILIYNEDREDFMIRLVEVEVLEIRHSGVLVKILGDNRVGFIRRRELSWDRRVGVTLPMLKIGDRFEAKVIQDRENVRYVYLSRRRLTDPWQHAKSKYHLDQVVQGEVVNIRSFGVFVQLEPGIDAAVWPQGIPLLRDQRLADVLSIGDKVQGIITHIELEKRKIEISLTRRLQELNIVPSNERKLIQLESFRHSLNSNELKYSSSNDLSTPTDEKPPPRRYRPPIPEPERLLVIEDNETDLQTICRHFKDFFKVEVVGVHSGKEALDKMKKELTFDLAVIDLNLVNERGESIAEMLLDLKPDLAIVFTSFDPLAGEKLTSINGQRFPFIVKDPEALTEQIDMLCTGYWEEMRSSDDVAYIGQGSFVNQLGMDALVRRPSLEVLQQILTRLRQTTEASQAMILEVDSVNKRVSIVATDPPLDKVIQEHSLDGLYYSPVREVVEDEETFYAKDIKPDRPPRFKYFFPLLAFKTCFGIPLKIPDLVTRHTLFLFDEHRSVFGPEVLNQARLTGSLIQIALERALLLDYMQRYEQRYTLGQLLGSLVHETKSKLDGLGGQAQRLSTILQKASSATEAADWSTQITKALEITNRIQQAQEELGELVQAYSRIVRDDLDAVDVNNVVRKVKRQLNTRAREAYIEIHLELQPELPLVRTIRSRLEQILINLVLNAIQQIERHGKRMHQIAQQKGKDSSLWQHGIIIVQSRYDENGGACPIQVTVIDTGPGIHYPQQEHIFLLDTSTRQRGHGLGLFISRNLAETMGGRLCLMDSLMFIGSAFMVELPKY